MQRFYYQPAWVDFSIFWGAIVAVIGFGVVLQMELGGYDGLYWPAIAIIVAAVIVAVIQVQARRLLLTKERLTVGRLLAANCLQLPLATINQVEIAKHSLCLDTKTYGKIKLVRLQNLQKLSSAFAENGVVVVQGKGSHRV